MKGVATDMLLGLMAAQQTHESRYFTEIAKLGKEFDMDVCRFTPDQADTETKSIKWERFDSANGTWIPGTFKIPDFIYDRCFHGLSREPSEIRKKINWLKEHSSFLGIGLPGKWEVYQQLNKSPLLQAFFPETHRVGSAAEILEHLERLKKVFIKPEYGSGGIGTYLLTKADDQITVSTTKKGSRYDRQFETTTQLNKWLHHLLKRYSYLCQPYLELSSENSEPFDLRVLLQKNERNQWIERGRGIRVGSKDTLTSNLTTGGEALSVEAFIKKNPHSFPLSAEQTIQHIIRTLPKEAEAVSQRLFELGIDLGIDKKGQIWILDINSKPGRKIIETLRHENMDTLYRAPFQYCKHLTANLQRAGNET